CFAPNTRITMGDGSQKPARQIKQGQFVWNPFLRRAQRIAKVIVGPEKIALYKIDFGKGTVTVTRAHPVWSGDGMKRAESLVAGKDRVRDPHGNLFPIARITKTFLAPDEKVWNFE